MSIIDIIKIASSKKILITKKNNIISFLRFFSFIIFSIEFFRGIFIHNNYELILSFIFFIIFIRLVIIYGNLLQRLIYYQNLEKICLDIINEKSNEFNYEKSNNKTHPYSYDLDIFGKKSLHEKINRCQTNFGNHALHNSLSNLLLDSNLIIERQNAIKELSLKIDWCTKFLATAKSKEISNFNEKSIQNWNFKETLSSVKLNILLKSLPSINAFFILIFLFAPFNLWNCFFITIPFLIRIYISRVYGKSINEIYKFVDVKSNDIKKYSLLFLLIEKEIFTSSKNKFLKNELKSTNNLTASHLIKKLSKLIDNFEKRNIVIFGGILNLLFLWDLQYATKIEKFIVDNQSKIPKWFDVIGEFETLISFGIFAYKNEDFLYPYCSDKLDKIEIKNVSHPLITKDKRIYNDFYIIRENIAIITGANMTGKSTFLRSIGINMVLAMNGCPVCASSFDFYPISIFTSMRTNDSLSDESSYFNAEIQRLKLLIEKLEKNEPQFIILDEILKGTNSIDKLKGSEMFLQKIMKISTLTNCLIATHDLDLTKMESKYPYQINNYCFELHNNNGELEPDYKLQNGVTKSMNAIDLMRKNKIID